VHISVIGTGFVGLVVGSCLADFGMLVTCADSDQMKVITKTNPVRTQEVFRVLQHNGLVYAETPFMQQVHLGRYDFTRFTHLVHRRLFRRFDEIESGASSGPGTALARSYRYFLSGFSDDKWLNWLSNAFPRLTSFHLKYFDYLLINKPGSYDAASAYYFLGRKGSQGSF
jgi:hypothetical protein